MKLRIMVLFVIGLAGVAASYALADGGKHHSRRDRSKCSPAVVFGTASAPQTLTITVARAGRHSAFTRGQVVTLTIGSTGQSVRVLANGCSDGSSLTARGAVLQAVGSLPPPPLATTAADTTTGTTTGSDSHHGRGHDHGSSGPPHGSTTTVYVTTTAATTTVGTTTVGTTTDGTTSVGTTTTDNSTTTTTR